MLFDFLFSFLITKSTSKEAAQGSGRLQGCTKEPSQAAVALGRFSSSRAGISVQTFASCRAGRHVREPYVEKNRHTSKSMGIKCWPLLERPHRGQTIHSRCQGMPKVQLRKVSKDASLWRTEGKSHAGPKRIKWRRKSRLRHPENLQSVGHSKIFSHQARKVILFSGLKISIACVSVEIRQVG